ncbi:MAG: pseudouridine synthase [Aeromicrobium sp.]|uniref:pseudouridine synthase n=1 Tax=Aeromicrobium sp. TaxID=1871063 RepID=UPI0039E41ABE
MLAEGRVVDAAGRAVRADDAYVPAAFLWFHREFADEPVVPGEMPVLFRDERIVVVDKPPFLATIPRGGHVRQSVQARLRRELDLPELQPVHRLDRLTSGVLVLATQRRWRGVYQSLFQRREVVKTYLALAAHDPSMSFPLVVRNHLRKDRGVWQVREVRGMPPNAETLIEMDRVLGEWAVYRLRPETGRTHQLRVHLAGLGLPIVGDPLYPRVLDVASDDFSSPLQLLASEIAFDDPVAGRPRRFTSARPFPFGDRGLPVAEV